ncbi:ATP-grasp domain-containing protein [Alteromonas sp. P256]|uniref:ATP-grasp domain-containing protein n=1 Tax=Alteromonas sp. P256 TaxID=3117399 RepID=UPI002FDF6BE0
MSQIVFLSTDNLDDFFVYDELLIPHFNDIGWSVETISWREKNVNWDQYDYVIVRSTWDYQQHPDTFLNTLEIINKSSAVLLNPLALIRWNIDKQYLKDLADAGIPIVDTRWGECFEAQDIHNAFARFNTEEVVVKPTLSANADDTFRVSSSNIADVMPSLLTTFAARRYMIQPFLSSVVEEGEYSLFYFGGCYSHAILKVPQQGDFRVQEEHGGQLLAVEANIAQQEIAQRALEAMPAQALYARVDLVRQENEWAIMELELIEPSLYFNLDTSSPARFVQALSTFSETE